MTPISPRLLKGGLVQIDPDTGTVLRVISLQYNPDTLTRTLQVQATSAGGGGDQSEALRLKGAAVETIKLEAEIDATDAARATRRRTRTRSRSASIPQLAVLEALVAAARRRPADERHPRRAPGVLEVLPIEAPLTLFVWSKQRVVPVRVTDLSITEEAFDVALNPIRAKVSLGLRVLSVDDLGFDHRGGTLFMAYLRNKEGLAGRAASVPLSALGVEGI